MNTIIKKYSLYQCLLVTGLLIFEVLFYFTIETFEYQLFVAIFFTFGILVLRQDYIIYSMLFMLPNQRLFIIPGTEFSLINVFIIFILLLHIKENYRFNKELKWLYLIIIIYSFLIAFINRDLNIIFHAIKTISIFIVLFTFVLKHFNKKDRTINAFIIFFASGVLFSSFIGFILDADYSLSSIGTKDRFSGGEFNNANIFGFDISFAISVLLVYLFYFKKNFAIVGITVVLLLIFGFLTQSRSFYLISALMLFAFFLKFGAVINKRNILPIFIIISIVIFSTFYWGSYIIEIFNAGFDRIINPKNGDISNNRFALWVIYLNYLISNPKSLILGIGFIDILEKVSAFNVAHNAFIEVIISWGLIGFLLFLGLFLQSYMKIKKNLDIKKTGYFAFKYLPLVVLLTSSITGHSFLSNPFIIKFFFSIFILFSLNENKMSDIVL